MLDLYLRDLERELSRTLPSEDVQARLAEAEAHLREGVEGRIELGLDPLDAEREAVAAFGEARRLARAEPPSPQGRVAPRLLILGAGYGLFLLYVQIGPAYFETYPGLSQWLFEGWIALGVAFAFASFRARRPRPWAVGTTALGATTLTWLFVGTTWLNLYAFGGGGVVPKGGAAALEAESRRALEEHRANRRAFDAGWTVLRGPQGIEGLRTDAGYRAPVVGQPSYRTPLRFENVPDAKTALHAWNDARQRGGDLWEASREAGDLSAIPLAESHPVENLISTAPDIVPPNVGVAAGAVLVDLAFGGLGLLVSRLKRGRRRTVA